jgi:hypothetical protein
MKPGNRQQQVEMVPIPTKHLLWEMRERIPLYVTLSALMQRGFSAFWRIFVT